MSDDLASDVAYGREIVEQGLLRPLRYKLGLTFSAMAELIQTSLLTYAAWEKRPDVQLWSSTAARIGRFYRSATAQLELLENEDIEVSEIMPLHAVSPLLSVPHEVLLKWYREGQFDALDLGILGLWIYREDLAGLKVKLG